jgi:Rrf2 family transcriptional regulator, nitric oxide-sensitive transcriptional repressor
MHITLYSDYSIRMLIYLGLRPGHVVPIHEIADAHGVSQHYLLKVANELSSLGYIDSIRGRSGGVRLSRAPKSINLGALMRSTEPAGGVLDCVTNDKADCMIVPACRLRAALAEAEAAFYAILDRLTLGDLLGPAAELKGFLGIDATT